MQAARGSSERLPAEALLRLCSYFATLATFRAVPEFTSRLLGRLGFGPLASLYRELGKDYASRMHSICCDRLEPEAFLEAAARANREAGSAFPLMPVSVSRVNGELRVVFRVPRGIVEEPCGGLVAAPLAGLIAGVYEAAGRRVAIASGAEAAAAAGTGRDVVVYVSACNGQEVVVAARPVEGEGRERGVATVD